MATEKQIAANRANALKSTGPRSLAGKTRSSVNAVRHGLTAQHAMLAGEDPREFSELRGAMLGSLNPQGALENQLVERAANLVWRMRRFPVVEVALFEWTAHLQSQLHDDPVDIENVERRNDLLDDSAPSDLQDKLKLGRVVEALLSADLTSRLSRYETGMQRQLSMALRDLRELQAARTALNSAEAAPGAGPKGDNDDEWVEYNGRKIKKIGPP